MKPDLEKFVKEAMDEFRDKFISVGDDKVYAAVGEVERFIENKLLEVAACTREVIVMDIKAVEKLDYYCECEGDIHFVAFTREAYDGLMEKLQEEY